jgi:hypothetical protein
MPFVPRDALSVVETKGIPGPIAGRIEPRKDRPMRTITSSMVMMMACLAATVPVRAAGPDEIRSLVAVAREKFARRQTLAEISWAKKALGNQIDELNHEKNSVATVVRNAKITMDSLPGRRNSIQQAAFAEANGYFLSGRARLTEIDFEIGELKTQMHQIDLAVLEKAEMDNKKPGPSNRRDILNVFPLAQEECNDALSSLRSAILSTTQDPVEATRLVRQANDELNQSGKGDARFGPIGPFLDELRKTNKARPVAPAKAVETKKKPSAKKR